MDLLTLFPSALSVADIVILAASAMISSAITAAMGIGGGILLLTIMAGIVPIAALIPVHGLVQLGSNGSRAVMTRDHIEWSLCKRFLIGAMMGAIAASLIVIQLPLQWIELAVASFILYMVWGPKPAKQQLSYKGQFLAGSFTTIASMFVGATGPLVAAFIHRNGMDKLPTTATFATCMSGQHLLKMLVFSVVGFSFWQWLPIVLLMICSGIVGTWLGLKVLKRTPSQYFSYIFKGVITVLSLRLLWQALG